MVRPSNEILYIYALPPWDPKDVTAFQGFAPGLIYLGPLMTVPVRLPPDIIDLTMSPVDRLARRRAGLGSWIWSPVNVDTLIRRHKPFPHQPFMVVFTANADVAQRVATWRRNLRIQPLHVSTIRKGGTIAPGALTVERLQQFCRGAVRQAGKVNRRLDIADSLAAIDRWQPFEERPFSLRYHTHNVTVANEMVLYSIGERAPERDEGVLNVSPHEDYVDGITESAQAVLALQAQVEDREAYLLHPPRPDIILFAPASYRGIERVLQRSVPSLPGVRAIRALERQRRYTMQIEIDENDIDEIGPVLGYRGAELRMQVAAVGLRAASTLAATIRLPPLINRTAGVVGQLARHLRAYDEDLPDRKTAKVFRIVQDALLDAIPPEHLALIRESKTGIKIIGNAPLEWIPLDGLPLGIHTDVSRIPVTPGNIMIEQLRPVPQLYIPAEQFKSYLALSMFEDGDRISNFMDAALQVLPGAQGARITGTHLRPRTVEEFIAVINNYTGPILIIDSHGSHPSDPDIGGLIIDGKPLDVWTLRDRVRLPPIVVLSACDTHPLDRSHATVANGFLSCGAIAVLGTVLPIRARDAATFLVRLMLRAIQYGEIVSRNERSVPWTNIVGGALRMQLASDICRGLRNRKILTEKQALEIQLAANWDINTLRGDWLPRLGKRCQKAGRFGNERWNVMYNDILAASDVIRYVHLGNPESITIADARILENADTVTN